jgi:hypothetical protein
MATNYGTPPIVSEGLIFAVDPRNKKSYPGTGTSVTDMISGISLSATSVSAYSNYWDIDSQNRVFKITGTDTLLSFSSQITMIGWFNWQGSGNVGRIIEMYGPSSNYVYGHTLALDNDGSVRGWMDRNTTTSARVLELDDATTYTSGWHMLSYTYDGSNARLYVDEQQTKTGAGSYSDLDDVANIAIGGGTSTYYVDAFIGPIQVYNRGLSATEVKQNYNALKWRFE